MLNVLNVWKNSPDEPNCGNFQQKFEILTIFENVSISQSIGNDHFFENLSHFIIADINVISHQHVEDFFEIFLAPCMDCTKIVRVRASAFYNLKFYFIESISPWIIANECQRYCLRGKYLKQNLFLTAILSKVKWVDRFDIQQKWSWQQPQIPSLLEPPQQYFFPGKFLLQCNWTTFDRVNNLTCWNHEHTSLGEEPQTRSQTEAQVELIKEQRCLYRLIDFIGSY